MRTLDNHVHATDTLQFDASLNVTGNAEKLTAVSDDNGCGTQR
jgi:hypothetical protein